MHSQILSKSERKYGDMQFTDLASWKVLIDAIVLIFFQGHFTNGQRVNFFSWEMGFTKLNVNTRCQIGMWMIIKIWNC